MFLRTDCTLPYIKDIVFVMMSVSVQFLLPRSEGLTIQKGSCYDDLEEKEVGGVERQLFEDCMRSLQITSGSPLVGVEEDGCSSQTQK